MSRRFKAKHTRNSNDRKRNALADDTRGARLSLKRMRQIKWEVSLAHAWRKRHGKPVVAGFGSYTCYCGDEGCHGTPA